MSRSRIFVFRLKYCTNQLGINFKKKCRTHILRETIVFTSIWPFFFVLVGVQLRLSAILLRRIHSSYRVFQPV